MFKLNNEFVTKVNYLVPFLSSSKVHIGEPEDKSNEIAWVFYILKKECSTKPNKKENLIFSSYQVKKSTESIGWALTVWQNKLFNLTSSTYISTSSCFSRLIKYVRCTMYITYSKIFRNWKYFIFPYVVEVVDICMFFICSPDRFVGSVIDKSVRKSLKKSIDYVYGTSNKVPTLLCICYVSPLNRMRRK